MGWGTRHTYYTIIMTVDRQHSTHYAMHYTIELGVDVWNVYVIV